MTSEVGVKVPVSYKSLLPYTMVFPAPTKHCQIDLSFRTTHLCLALEVESEDIFTTSCLTLPYQEDTMGASASF